MPAWSRPRPSTLASGTAEWVRSNGRRPLKVAVISFSITWFINFVVMTTRGSSFADLVASTTSGNTGVGIVYWAVLSVTVGALVAYGLEVGWAELRASFRAIPTAIARLFREQGWLAWSLLVWGASVTLALSGVMAPTVSAAFGVGLVGFAPTAVTGLIGRVFAMAWVAAADFALPRGKPAAPGLGGHLVVTVGSAIGFLAASRASALAVRLVAAVVLAVAANLLLAKRSSPVTSVLGVAAMAGAWWYALDGVAAALGGCCGGAAHGIKEGSEAARLALTGGLAGAAGGVAGAGLGSALAASAPPDPSEWDWGPDDGPPSLDDSPRGPEPGPGAEEEPSGAPGDEGDPGTPSPEPSTKPPETEGSQSAVATDGTPAPPPPPADLDDIPDTDTGTPPPPPP